MSFFREDILRITVFISETLFSLFLFLSSQAVLFLSF
jgi:hypothetical protein